MTRVWAAVRPLALTAAAAVGLYWVGYVLGRWARRSGYSPDKQARSRADETRRRGLGEPDHFDVLPDPPATQPDPFWRHQPLFSGITHIARRGEPCGSCGQEEPT